jgi:hypothetical protein
MPTRVCRRCPLTQTLLYTLMWWKQHVQDFPRLTRMVRQYLTVSATSVSPERLFSSVGLVKSDLWGNLVDTTLIDVIWAKQAP